jgi:hypothetical protein
MVALARLVGQSSDSLKAPVTEMLLMVSGPTALSVTICGALVDPTLVNGKFTFPLDVFNAAKAEMLRMKKLYRSATWKLPEASSDMPEG